MPRPGSLIRCTRSSGCEGRRRANLEGPCSPGQRAVLISYHSHMRYRFMYIPELVMSQDWANFHDFWVVEDTPEELSPKIREQVVRAIVKVATDNV